MNLNVTIPDIQLLSHDGWTQVTLYIHSDENGGYQVLVAQDTKAVTETQVRAVAAMNQVLRKL